MNFFLKVLILTFAECIFTQKDPNIWEDRNTIVHLFEWKWLDIARECEDFLQHKGYAGVQVSPVNENLLIENRPWWERYQPMSYELQTRSGNEEDFLNMTKRCNAVGIRIYVDVVLNHMTGNITNAIGTAGSIADPSHKFYPCVPYTSDDFHESCSINDYSDSTEVRNCELLGLQDINQTRENVLAIQINFLNHLVDLGVAGFRIDAAKHMWPKDLGVLYTSVKNLSTSFGFLPGSRPFIYQEVLDFGNGTVSRDEYIPLGVVTEFVYGRNLAKLFRSNQLDDLATWGPKWGLVPKIDDALAFIDNHDNQRHQDDIILTYKEPKLYIKAIAFMLAHPYGITRIMSSFAFESVNQGPPQDEDGNIISPHINEDGSCSKAWVCEHRWPQIYRMVQFKNTIKDTRIKEFWSNGSDQIALCRGDKGFIAFTNGGTLNIDLNICLPPGNYCDIISGEPIDGKCSGQTLTIKDNGAIQINLDDDQYGVLAIHVDARI